MRGLLNALVVLVLLLVSQTSLMAQDFNALLQAVDKVEANLKALVEQESTARQQEVQKLRTEMKQTPATGGAVDNSVLAQMQQELQTLKAEVAKLAAQKTQPSLSEADLSNLVSDIASIKAEMSTLQANNASNQKLLASLDNEGFYVPEQQDTVLDKIYERLGTINKQLEGAALKNGSDINAARIGHGKIAVTGFVHSHFVDPSHEKSTFRTRRAELGVSGELNKYARIKVVSQFAGSTPALNDAELTVSPHPNWSMSLGQYKTPFGTDFLVSSTSMPFINSSLASAYGPNRDIGASLSYRQKVSKQFNFKLTSGVFNGSGVNTTDANGRKNFVFRGEFQFFNMFTFASNVLDGKDNGVDSVAKDMTVYGASLGWKWSKTQVMAEMIYNQTGTTDKAGWYTYASQGLSTGWQFLPMVEFLTRYEQTDPNRAVTKNTTSRLTFGTNLFVDDKYTKLQFNVDLDDTGDHLGQKTTTSINLQMAF